MEDDKPYEGLQSHREALTVVFDRLVENSIEDLKGIRERFGDDRANQLLPLVYDIDKAQPTPLDPDDFFYCPNIVKTDYYGSAYYDAVWEPNDDNCGTTVPYWYALMEPVHGKRNKPVIPHQLYWFELKKILANAAVYLPFLNEKDADGLRVRYTGHGSPLFLHSLAIPVKHSGKGWSPKGESFETQNGVKSQKTERKCS